MQDKDLDAIEQYANVIYSSAHQTFRLLENLLDWANSQRGNIIVSVDKNMIKSILRNLVTNAIKFTPKNGKIELSSSIYGRYVEIVVKGNGIGMNKMTLEQLF